MPAAAATAAMEAGSIAAVDNMAVVEDGVPVPGAVVPAAVNGIVGQNRGLWDDIGIASPEVALMGFVAVPLDTTDVADFACSAGFLSDASALKLEPTLLLLESEFELLVGVLFVLEGVLLREFDRMTLPTFSPAPLSIDREFVIGGGWFAVAPC